MKQISRAISWGSLISLLILAIAWFTGAARWAQHWLIVRDGHEFPIRLWTLFPTMFVVCCGLLVSVRWIASPRDAWRIGRAVEHAAVAFVGGSFVLICQTLLPRGWLLPAIGMVLIAAPMNQILFRRRANWAAVIWLAAGLVIADLLLPGSSASARGTPLYLLWLAMVITIWNAMVPRGDDRLSWWLCGLSESPESRQLFQR
jgi:hypothetical protein